MAVDTQAPRRHHPKATAEDAAAVPKPMTNPAEEAYFESWHSMWLETVTPDPPDDIPDELWGIVGNGHVVAVYQFRKDAEELKAHLPKSEIEFKVIRYVPEDMK